MPIEIADFTAEPPLRHGVFICTPEGYPAQRRATRMIWGIDRTSYKRKLEKTASPGPGKPKRGGGYVCTKEVYLSRDLLTQGL